MMEVAMDAVSYNITICMPDGTMFTKLQPRRPSDVSILIRAQYNRENTLK